MGRAKHLRSLKISLHDYVTGDLFFSFHLAVDIQRNCYYLYVSSVYVSIRNRHFEYPTFMGYINVTLIVF